MKKIIEVKFGSHLYGTDTPESDLDLKGVFLPTKEELLSGHHPRNIQNKRKKRQGEKNTKDDVDVEMFSLDRFLELLTEGQTVALDMLFAPDQNVTDEGRLAYASPEGRLWDEIKANKEILLTKDVTAFVGYARKQASKYGVKGSRVAAVREVLEVLKPLHPHSKLGEHSALIDDLIRRTQQHVSMEKSPLVEIIELPAHKDGPPQKYLSCCGRKVPFTNKVLDAVKVYQRTFDEYGARALQAGSNHGVDWKAVSHSVRVNSEAMELLTTGKITLPLPNRDLILAIKKGELPFKDVAYMIEKGLADLESARAQSHLPEAADKKWCDDFIAKVYSEICGQSWPIQPSLASRIVRDLKNKLREFPAVRTLKRVIGMYRKAKWHLKSRVLKTFGFSQKRKRS